MACDAARERVLIVPSSLQLDGGPSQQILSASQKSIPQCDIDQQIAEVS